jgi:magnesium transporter
MEPVVLDDVLAQVHAALESNDIKTASSIIESLRPADQADLFWDLSEQERTILLPHINPADAADIFEELYDQDVAEVAVQLPMATLVRIVDEMEPDEAADLLDDLDPKQADLILAQLEAAHQIKPLINFDDDSAGGLMTSSFIALQRRMTAAQAIAALRMWHPDEEAIYYIFVTDRLKRLVGVVNLRQLIVAAPHAPVASFMDTDVIHVNAGTDQEACADLMQRYNLLALPVVDEKLHLLGIITIDDLVDVIQAEASEDIQRLGGSEPLNRAYLDTSIFTITRKRIGWLFILFGTATLTAGVMNAYQSVLESIVVLAIFIPMLIGTGGNAGSQTTSTIIRALAVGDVEWRDAWKVWLHELGVGALMGLLMGLTALVLAFIWVNDFFVALTVAISIFGIVIWSTSAGSLLPLIADRLKIDPTVVSAPAMSTIVDATGLIIYFSVARLILF